MTQSTRPMTSTELEMLSGLASKDAYRRSLLRQTWYTYVLMSIVLVIAGIAIWQLGAFLARTFMAWEIGWDNPHSDTILAVIVFLSVIYGFSTMRKSLQSPSDWHDDVAKDIYGQTVAVETLSLTNVMVLQEPEHGGLLYLLRTADDRVYATYDHESQNLGVAGKNPLDSSFVPRSTLTRGVAPHSRIVLEEGFSGDPLDAGEPIEITADPREWPESNQYVDIAWDEITDRLCN